ncbi:unnamed protein product [Aureobasidium pullulans]|nr:unnamed protein product [Aureobasidium pullulans]
MSNNRAHGDLNNTEVMRDELLVPDPAYDGKSLAIKEQDDNTGIRTRYRPFITMQELRELSKWVTVMSGYLLSSTTAVFKNQIDWVPLSTGSVRPTQGRTLAIAQVSGGSQSFNTSSVPMAYTQFTDAQDPTDQDAFAKQKEAADLSPPAIGIE